MYKTNLATLFIFATSSILAISLKHLGLFYFVSLGLSYLIWATIKRQVNVKLVATYFISLFIGLSFYPTKSTYAYLTNAIAHNDTLNLNTFFTISISLTIFLGGIFYITNFGKSEKALLPKIFLNFISSLFLSGVICFFIVKPTYPTTTLCTAILCLNITIIAIFSYYFCLNSLRGFTYIFIFVSLSAAGLLYFSHIGKSFYVFAIPLLLCFYQSFCETKNPKLFAFIIIGQIFISNFFPSLEFLNAKYPNLGDKIYTTIFNTTYINYLSWTPCIIPKTRKEIEGIISQMDLPADQNKLIFINLHQHTQVSLYLAYNLQANHPAFSKIEDSASKDLVLLKSATINNITEIFSKAESSNMFPVIIEAVKPFTESQNQTTDSLVEVLMNDKKSLNEFAQVFALEYFKRLQKSNSLETYYKHVLIPTDQPVIKLHIKKSISTNHQKQVSNSELEELIKHHRFLTNKK